MTPPRTPLRARRNSMATTVLYVHAARPPPRRAPTFDNPIPTPPPLPLPFAALPQQPLNFCSETRAGSGVWTRNFTKLNLEMDCNTFQAQFTPL